MRDYFRYVFWRFHRRPQPGDRYVFRLDDDEIRDFVEWPAVEVIEVVGDVARVRYADGSDALKPLRNLIAFYALDTRP